MPTSPNPWNDIFQKDGRVFLQPHPDLPALSQRLKARSARRILDLGCGTGRHLVYLAGLGFEVTGLDHAHQGLAQAQHWLTESRLPARLAQIDMHQPLPCPDACFDAVISTQVIHHARLAGVKAIIAEIHRVLKPGGLVYVTVAAPKEATGASIEIEPNTFIPLGGMEKGLPHHLFTAEELTACFSAFEVEDVHLDDTNHYCLTGLKKR